MLCVFPFSSTDRHQLISLFQLLTDWGVATQPFHCLLACEQGLDSDEIKTLAGRLFKSAAVQHVRAAHDSWPAAPNSYFQQVAEAVAANTSEPWWWHEADLTPLVPTYMQDIHMDFVTAGKRFYGPVCGTYQRRDPNDASKGFVQASEHLIGTAIYPADYFVSVDGMYDENKAPVRESIVRFIVSNTTESLRAGHHAVPFDVFLEAETTPLAHRSTLIQHAWRSRNYREEGGRIVFDVEVNYGQDLYIRNGVALVHGEKDGSLMRIIRRRAGLDGAPIQIQSPVIAGGEWDSTHSHKVSPEGSTPSSGTIPSAVSNGAPGEPATGGIVLTPHETRTAEHPKVLQVRLGTNGGSVIFSDGSSQLVTSDQIIPFGGRSKRDRETQVRTQKLEAQIAALDRGSKRGRRMTKKRHKRTAEEQAKINLRMAALRARKTKAKVRRQNPMVSAQ